MQPEIENILLLLRRTFEKGAWHGPSVKETVEGLSEAEAFKRIPGTHSIITLVAHMAAWRKYVAIKLRGDLAYKVSNELNFPEPESWDAALRELYDSQNELLAAIKSFPAASLMEQVPWTSDPFTYYTILHGIIHHDMYHVGQINLIKKAGVAQPL